MVSTSIIYLYTVVLLFTRCFLLIACRSSQQQHSATLAQAEAKALETWQALLSEPDKRLQNDSYFDEFNEADWM